MRRFSAFLAALLVVTLCLVPALAEARAGGGSSFGSRGMQTYSAPPSTATSPYGAAPMQRSLTPQAPSGYGSGYGQSYGGYGGGYGYGARSPFMTGIMGGLIGAGIGGMLFGHGMFGGIHGFGSVFGLLIQILLIVFLVRLAFRFFFNRQPVFAGSARGPVGAAPGPMGGGFGGAAAPSAPPIAVSRADYQAFAQLLQDVQAAWSAQDLNALRGMATPEMVGYFSEQLGEQASQGVRNQVTAVRLEQGDLAEAWSESSREYATVAMRFSMLDVTRDAQGRIVAGSDTTRTQATELWTFLRAPGGRWILSAIQQSR